MFKPMDMEALILATQNPQLVILLSVLAGTLFVLALAVLLARDVRA